MNWIIAWITGGIFIIGVCYAHYHGHKMGYEQGKKEAEDTANRAWKRDTTLWFHRNYSRN